MKKAITFFVLVFLFNSSFSQIWIRPADAGKHKGEIVNFIGLVTDIRYLTNEKESPTFISIGGKNTSEVIRLVVRNTDRINFKVAPETAYLEQYVQVRGKVEIYNGKPQIVIRNEKQIIIARETPPEE